MYVFRCRTFYTPFFHFAAAKISTQETSQLGSQARYMNKLLSIVRKKVTEKTMDVTLKFSLSALWNLTDESPQTCNVFLQEGGMQLFLQVRHLLLSPPLLFSMFEIQGMSKFRTSEIWMEGNLEYGQIYGHLNWIDLNALYVLDQFGFWLFAFRIGTAVRILND